MTKMKSLASQVQVSMGSGTESVGVKEWMIMPLTLELMNVVVPVKLAQLKQQSGEMAPIQWAETNAEMGWVSNLWAARYQGSRQKA